MMVVESIGWRYRVFLLLTLLILLIVLLLIDTFIFDFFGGW
jgi:hypothetical protein